MNISDYTRHFAILESEEERRARLSVELSWLAFCDADKEKLSFEEGAEVSFQDTAPSNDGPLSKSHIRPRTRKLGDKERKNPKLIWRAGASILKVTKGGDGSEKGGGMKKKITGFSANSRRGLMYTIASIRRDADLPCFVTITYPKTFPTPKQSKRHLKIFIQRLLRAFPALSAIWKLEPQDRGAPHYHLLVWGVDEKELKKFVPLAWHDIAGGGDEYHLLFHLGLLERSKHCVSLVNSFRGVWAYASKYLGKSFDVAGWNDLHTGRFWGCANKEKLPFGAECSLEVTRSKVCHIMRYQRRFVKRKMKKKEKNKQKVSGQGYTVFCDASQWVNNICREV